MTGEGELTRAATEWLERGTFRTLCDRRIFTVDVAPGGPESQPPLLVLHGFPTSSFDFHRVVDRLAADRRVLLFDMLGYGLSDKAGPGLLLVAACRPTSPWPTWRRSAMERLGLLTHDVGDTRRGRAAGPGAGGGVGGGGDRPHADQRQHLPRDWRGSARGAASAC